MKRFSIILLSVLLCYSCKKEKLEGDFEFLVGQWEYNFSSSIEFGFLFEPEHTIEFFQSGKFRIEYSSDKKGKGRVLSTEVGNPSHLITLIHDNGEQYLNGDYSLLHTKDDSSNFIRLIEQTPFNPLTIYYNRKN